MTPQALDFALSIILAVTTMIIGFFGGRLRAKVKREMKEDAAMKNGMRCLLRERIIEICDRCLERDFVRIHSLESLGDLFEQYKALGGNGTAAKLIEDVKKLQVK